MLLQVKFFASLRQRFGENGCEMDVTPGTTVGELWGELSGESEMAGNVRAAVNFDYVSTEHRLQANDEVAFFPPVTGG